MSETSIVKRAEGYSAYFRTITWFNLLLAVQLAAGIMYAVFVDVAIQNLRYYLLPYLDYYWNDGNLVY